MPLMIDGKTPCLICGQQLNASDEIIGFPAFIPKGHELWKYNERAFHRSCFASWEHHERLLELYEKFRAIWDSRPKHLSYEESEEWSKHAFDDIFRDGMK